MSKKGRLQRRRGAEEEGRRAGGGMVAGMALAVDTPAHLLLLRTEELARRLHVRPSTVRWWARRHGLPVVRIGRLVRYRAGDVARWLGETDNRRAWALCGLMRNELAALGRPGDAERVRAWKQ